MTYKENTMASTNHTESFNLLLTGSDSGSDIPDFTVPKKKVRVKRKSRQTTPTQRKRSLGLKHGAASFCNSSCSTSLCVSFIMIVVAILMVLIWFIIQLRFQLDQLGSKFNSVEASNNGMPEELHIIHTKLNNLEKNYTLIKQNITKLSDDVVKINKQISDLQATTNDIKSSIAAAPIIKNLPDDVMKLSENVASLGSKITNVEDKLEKLKTQHSDFDEKHKSFTSTIKQIQDKVSSISVPNKPPAVATDGDSINKLNQNMQSLGEKFDDLNTTLNSDLKSVRMETSDLSEEVKTLSSSAQPNSSYPLNQSIKDYINETIKKSLVINFSNKGPVRTNVSVSEVLTDVNSLSRLYLQLLLKLNQSANILAPDRNSSVVVDEILNKFVNMYTSSNYFTDLSDNVVRLNVSVTELQLNERNLTSQIDHALNLIHQLSLHHSQDFSSKETTSVTVSQTTSESRTDVNQSPSSSSKSKSQSSYTTRSTSPGG